MVPQAKPGREGQATPKEVPKPMLPPPNVIRAKPLRPLVAQGSMGALQKPKPEVFEIIGKFFPKALNQYSPAELKAIHYDIINDMIVYEEKFLSDHREQLKGSKEILAKEEQELKIIEDPQSSIEAYLKNSDEILTKELELTKALQKKLSLFKKYLAEEKVFAKKYIIPQDLQKPSGSQNDRSFEISDTHKLQRLSSGSLLLDD